MVAPAAHREYALFGVAARRHRAPRDGRRVPRTGAWDAMERPPAARIRDARDPGAAAATRPATRARGPCGGRRSARRAGARRSGTSGRRDARGRCPRGGLDGFLLAPVGLVCCGLAATTALALAQAGRAALPAPRRDRARQRRRGLLDRAYPSPSRSSRPTGRAPSSSRRPRDAVRDGDREDERWPRPRRRGTSPRGMGQR